MSKLVKRIRLYKSLIISLPWTIWKCGRNHGTRRIDCA